MMDFSLLKACEDCAATQLLYLTKCNIKGLSMPRQTLIAPTEEDTEHSVSLTSDVLYLVTFSVLKSHFLHLHSSSGQDPTAQGFATLSNQVKRVSTRCIHCYVL